MSYWTKRQDQLKESAEKEENRIKNRLSSFYDSELKRLEKDIAAYYQEYGEDNVIAYRNLIQSLSNEDRTLLMERMDDFAEKYPQYADLLPVRESIYRLDRLQGLQYSVYMAEAEIAGYTAEQIREYETTISQKGLNYAMEALGFGKNFYAINSDIVKSFVDVPWCNGENFSTRIWNDTQKLAQYLSQDIAQGFARGDSYDRLVRQIRQRFSRVNRRDAYRLIYTEGTYVMAESSIQPFTEDFSQYRISTVGDSRVCEICRAMSENVFEISERQPGINFPPFHPWCRCTFTIEVNDWDQWMDDYVAKHSGNKNQAKKIANRMGSDIIKKKKRLRMNLQLFAKMPEEKFTKYALNYEKAPDKARAFEEALGYTNDNYQELIDNIKEHYDRSKLIAKGDHGYGMLYESIMRLKGPNGKEANVLTAWIEDGDDVRLTSVYVTKKKVTQ